MRTISEVVAALKALVHPVPMPPANDGPSTYRADALTDADKIYLMRMETPYRIALSHVPGAHQIFFDILCNSDNKTWAQLGYDASAQGLAMKLQVNTIINYTDRLPGAYRDDPTQYNGPLVAVLGSLVAKKLASVS